MARSGGIRRSGNSNARRGAQGAIMSMTIEGRLQLGYCDENGVWHKDFTMRLATLEDVECAIEDALAEAGENASPARILRHQWARVLTRLGTVPGERITADMLGGLEATEYGVLRDAQEQLRKKLMAASEASCGNAAC